jgi:membrane associated rhomboid family serine protease
MAVAASVPADRGSLGLFNAKPQRGGVAFFAHVGGFIFGVLITRLLVWAGQVTPQARYADSPP